MAGIAVEEGSALAHSIQSAVQAKLIENTWAAEENDTTLSEYVTMMLVNGKDFHGVQSELGGELLGIGEDDPSVVDFTRWLFEQVQGMAGPQQVAAAEDSGMNGNGEQQQDGTSVQGAQDSEMGDAAATATAEGVPSGPKAMRNGSGPGSMVGRGRGGRMLGQVNRQMDRTPDDPLRRIKGAASGAGRIDAHNSRAPRGPRGAHQNVANGMQRMMNGRGGAQSGAMNMNPMAQPANGPLGALDPTQQMAFMQMMEMQANMMANMIQTGQMPNMGGQQSDFSGGQRGGRGRGGKSLFDRMDKRGGRGGHQQQRQQQTPQQDGDVSMEVDVAEKKGTPFDTMCKFNLGCTNPTCPFAHQSPANTRPGITVDLSDTCTHGIACTNSKCTARHPSPASRHGASTHAAPYSANGKIDADCKFFPNCTAGPMCPFRHPDTRPCRNGADCTVPGCTFAHSTIPCRYNPCTRPDCPFKHADGQKRGKFEDKVWTPGNGEQGAEGGANGSKVDRFAELKGNEGLAEELILPGQGQQQANGEGQAAASQQMDTVS